MVQASGRVRDKGKGSGMIERRDWTVDGFIWSNDDEEDDDDHDEDEKGGGQDERRLLWELRAPHWVQIMSPIFYS